MAFQMDEFTQTAKPEFKQIVEGIDAAVAASGCKLDRAVKWGQLTYARDGDFHHWICAIKITKQFVGLNFHFGGLLADPSGVLMAGASKFIRKIEYRQPGDVDASVIQGFLGQALDKLEYFKTHWKEIQAAG